MNSITSEKLLRFALSPQRWAYAVCRHLPVRSFDLRLALDLLPRPSYGLCLTEAARLASALGLKRISAIEFGVAGGQGLLALEQISDLVQQETGVAIDVFGFDRASGMPVPADYRDIPYFWRAGDFAMDVEALSRTLKKAKLIIGDVATTVPEFLTSAEFAPIGFVAFDLDHYTPTKAALNILTVPHNRILPRVICYFDDVLSTPSLHVHEYVGELRAIAEFNKEQPAVKVAKIEGLAYRRVFRHQWLECIYMMHSFEHPLYNKPVGALISDLPLPTSQLPGPGRNAKSRDHRT